MIERVKGNASVVLVGSINPGIFHPYWFEKQGLLPANETHDANVDVISNDVAIFTMSWLRLEAVRDRFIARTVDESKLGPLRDVVLGSFSLLGFTPITQIGLNRDIRYRLSDEESWHRVGHNLAPKKWWDPYLKSPGLKSMTIQALRDDDRRGAFHVVVKPVLDDPTAKGEWLVEVSFNDHIDLGEDKLATDACAVIEADWEKSLKRAEDLARELIQSTVRSE